MLEQLSGATRVFPIIGDPIRYVESPGRLTASLEGRGHDAVCIPIQVPQDALDTVMRALAATPNVDGLLVTMPHKSAVFGYCATSSDRADLLRVVSVIRRNSDGTWHADILDGLAFVKAQTDRGAHVQDATVLLLGAGGAGSAIADAMLDAGAGEVVVHDPDQQRADDLVALLADRGTGTGTGTARVGSPDPAGCDLICNATPLGMNDTDPLPLDPDALEPSMFVGDVIAGHGTTALVAAAEKAGCATANGSDMVVAVQELMLDFLLDDTS